MRSRRTGVVLSTALLMALVSACSGSSNSPKATGNEEPAGSSSASASSTPTSSAQITSSIAAGAQNVKVNRMVRLDVADGTFSAVTITSKAGRIAGALAADKASWQSSGRLQPGALYRVRGVATDESGNETVYNARFRTQKLGLDQQTYPSFFPTAGSTVGVGLPVVIRFDKPVTDHETFQKHITVTSVPAQAGAFHWISDTELHWRPEKYWKAGTKVSVDADIDSVPAGKGVYGQISRKNNFTIGRSMISKVNMNTHEMKVFKNGKLLRTLPITTGQQPEFTTRSGVKVIVEKDRRHDMNSETIGIDPNGPNGYNLKGVEYAMRLTYSGEFIHAAPWSVASQGHANVSHGCTGMSTANAGWLYDNSMIGDVVEYVGTSRQMTLTNGIGDWNLPFSQYAQGSAL